MNSRRPVNSDVGGYNRVILEGEELKKKHRIVATANVAAWHIVVRWNRKGSSNQQPKGANHLVPREKPIIHSMHRSAGMANGADVPSALISPRL